jgi:hypothetical protein
MEGRRTVTSRWERVGRYFPLPLVSVAVLLVVVIFITPNLTSPAGTLPTQAALLIDRIVGTNSTSFYVRALGTTRYAEVSVALAPNAVWPSKNPPTPPFNFSNTTVFTNTLGVSVTTTLNPVALNVTATYRDTTGTCVAYIGTYVFYTAYATQTLNYQDLTPSGTPGTQSAPVSSLPLSLLLNSISLGTC